MKNSRGGELLIGSIRPEVLGQAGRSSPQRPPGGTLHCAANVLHCSTVGGDGVGLHPVFFGN